MAATTASAAESSYQKYMAESVKRFSRSIELCDDYLRGYYGLKLVRAPFLVRPACVAPNLLMQTASRLLNETNKSVKLVDGEDFQLPDIVTLQRLSELATSKLSEIVRRQAAGDARWQGYDEAEITAARTLLATEAPAIAR
jgi:ER membrane protein complex subunit 2